MERAQAATQVRDAVLEGDLAGTGARQALQGLRGALSGERHVRRGLEDDAAARLLAVEGSVRAQRLLDGGGVLWLVLGSKNLRRAGDKSRNLSLIKN